MSSPLVSVIIPVYNAENTLRRCVDSVIAQTYSDVEIILVNDGSRDASGSICDEYAAYDRRITVVHRTNGGESAARNTGLAHACGRYIQHVDSDDWLVSTATEELTTALRESGADLVVCSFNRVKGEQIHPVKLGIEGIHPPDRQLMEFAYGLPDALLRFGASWNKLYRRDIIEQHGLRFEETRRANEDAHFNINYINLITHVFFIDHTLYNYVVPDGRATATTAYRPMAFEMNERIYRSIEMVIGAHLNDDERRVLNRHYLDKILIVLKMLCRDNDYYSQEELCTKVKFIVDHTHVRAALDNFHPNGTQENTAINMLMAKDYSGILHYAKAGAQLIYKG